MGLFNGPVKFKNQDYSSLRKKAQKSGNLFIDTEFPPDQKSLGTSNSGVDWKRPKDICEEPQLFVGGASANDLVQGEMGNCWLVAACSCVAIHKEVWTRVVPDHADQEWSTDEPQRYAGIFRFRFWRYGQWIEVVVDDQLPTKNRRLIFCHSKSKNEFWSALLEKAYAKLFGSYAALDGGELAEGLEDFTGGVSESIDLVEGLYAADAAKRDELYSTAKKNFDHGALMAAAIPAKSQSEMETSTDIGLVVGHAYGITAVKRVALAGTGIFGMFNQDKIDMVRLRNPWGGTEWKGSFSDGSNEWKKISKSDREKVGLTFEDDGEFWMLFSDFCKFFHSMCICRVVNTKVLSIRKTWEESVLHSGWDGPNRNGGCVNNRETFLNNPQFCFDITPKEDDCLFSLTQKTSRGKPDDTKFTIGFSVLKVEVNRRYRIHTIDNLVKSSEFKNSRSIFLRHTLPKGRYVVVLCTFEPGKKSDFMFRMYTDTRHNGQLLKFDSPQKSLLNNICCCLPCGQFPVFATKVKVVQAVGLQKAEGGAVDAYVIIQNERTSVRSDTLTSTDKPDWNFSAVFYRTKPVQKHIIIQVWHENVMRDECLGQAVVEVAEEMTNKQLELDLYDHKNPTSKKQGRMLVIMSSYRDMAKI